MSAKHPLPTSEEVDRRLRIVTELRNLCLSLGRARPMANTPVVDPPTVPEAKAGEVSPRV